jgi:hypothetical protein
VRRRRDEPRKTVDRSRAPDKTAHHEVHAGAGLGGDGGAVPAPQAQATLQAGASIDGGGAIIAVDNIVVNTCGGGNIVGPCQLPDLDPTLGASLGGPAS